MARSRSLRSGFVMALLVAVMAVGNMRESVAQSGQVQWQGVERVIAFADVHGAFTELLALFREAGIVDAQAHWIAGRTHVVSLGDLLDRGADSRKVLDLLMRLQVEALAAGGQLHVVLGNHEMMNVTGDLRYVDAGEYASYAEMESAAERAQLRHAWEDAQGTGSGAAFDQKFPPGYFGHRAAFSPTGVYGMWLLTLPVAIVINDTLFMHGGPSAALGGMNLQALNRNYRAALEDYLRPLSQLEQAKLLQPGDDFEARVQLATERLKVTAGTNGNAASPALGDAIRGLAAAADSSLLSQEGPNWYRGDALCNEAAEADVLLPKLQQFGAARLVIGHTPTRASRVVTRFEDRVVLLDAGMNRAVYKGRAAALFLEPGGLSVRYAGEPGVVPPMPEGLFVAPAALDDATVLAALREGEVSVTEPRAPNVLNVLVSHGGRRIPAVFQLRDAKAVRKEIAAYRLDRLMRLGVVPATVEREVDGKRGVLQARPVQWLTQADAQRQAVRAGGACSMGSQFQLLYALDVLMGNEARTSASILFDSNEWYVYSTSHERAFGATKGLPAYLKARPPAPGAEIRRRAAALDEAGLQVALGNLVDARGVKAILQRRDVLMALPGAQPP